MTDDKVKHSIGLLTVESSRSRSVDNGHVNGNRPAVA